MDQDNRLDRLWEAYRMATPEPEPSVNFMPELWARIEASQRLSWVEPLGRLVLRFAPLAAALIVMGLFWWNPRSTTADVAQTGYVEVLVADLLEAERPALWIGGEDVI